MLKPIISPRLHFKRSRPGWELLLIFKDRIREPRDSVLPTKGVISSVYLSVTLVFSSPCVDLCPKVGEVVPWFYTLSSVKPGVFGRVDGRPIVTHWVTLRLLYGSSRDGFKDWVL